LANNYGIIKGLTFFKSFNTSCWEVRTFTSTKPKKGSQCSFYLSIYKYN